jgi:hypothetical protein
LARRSEHTYVVVWIAVCMSVGLMSPRTPPALLWSGGSPRQFLVARLDLNSSLLFFWGLIPPGILPRTAGVCLPFGPLGILSLMRLGQGKPVVYWVVVVVVVVLRLSWSFPAVVLASWIDFLFPFLCSALFPSISLLVWQVLLPRKCTADRPCEARIV